MAKALQKPGKEGPLFLYRITYTGQENDPGMTPMTWNTWAYDLGHAEDNFYDTDEGEGWTILSIARVLDSTSQHRTIQHRPRHAMEARRPRREEYRREDELVTDKVMMPKAVSSRIAKDLKTRLGRGAEVEVLSSRTTTPRSWDYGNLTEIKVTHGDATTLVDFQINVAREESSGTAIIPSPGSFGRVISTARASTPSEVISRLVSDAASQL